MKLKPEEIKRIAGLLLRTLTQKKLIEAKVSETQIAARIESVIQQNMDEEISIENQARKLMDQYRNQIASGAIDAQKAFLMIKKQIAKERKFIL